MKKTPTVKQIKKKLKSNPKKATAGMDFSEWLTRNDEKAYRNL
jgi:hypothetical protein